MEREICYTKNFQILCQHYNRYSEIVILEDDGDSEFSGECPVCNTKYIHRDET